VPNQTTADVMIVGAGPVGLTLAIELGSRGVSCILVEQNAEALFLPKMELCNPRTMEIFRRLGVADQVRSAGYDPDLPMDVVITRKVSGAPVIRLAYSSINAAAQANARQNDGASPREVYQRISQYSLEPLFKRIAERLPGVSVRFATTLMDLRQDDAGVTAVVRTGGAEEEVRVRYLVGCDGAGSTVRRTLGIKLTGHSQGPELCHVFFRSDDLMKDPLIEPARHYYIVGEHNATIITQDTPEYFGMHAAVPPTADVESLIDELVGRPVTKTIIHKGTWQPRLLIADHYAQGRIFLAGDAAHQYIPFGGYGMNTGIGDVHDLAWKLDATLKGWGGEALLESYDEERRPVGARNLTASEENTLAMLKWRRTFEVASAEGLPREVVDARTAQCANVEQRHSHERTAIELGYSYSGSSIIAPEPGEVAPDPGTGRYRPSAAPGNRLPHLWLEEGRSIHDLLGQGFTLLTLDGSDDAAPLAQALAAVGVSCETIVLDNAEARAIMERRILLVRPDEHVAWRGDSVPDDPTAIAQRVVGRRVTA
jgi:2-polyprenyl-6-methoxyphenol hydroxylase-like FAD-dependent oxidoreductase